MEPPVVRQQSVRKQKELRRPDALQQVAIPALARTVAAVAVPAEAQRRQVQAAQRWAYPPPEVDSAESASPQAPPGAARLASVVQVRQLERGRPALACEPAAPRSVQLAREHVLEPRVLPGESPPGRTVLSL
jgi:hypothetical protein